MEEETEKICEFCGGENGEHELIEHMWIGYDGSPSYSTEKCLAVLDKDL